MIDAVAAIGTAMSVVMLLALHIQQERRQRRAHEELVAFLRRAEEARPL